MSAAPFGLYLHVPYCRRACTYCDFYFSTSQRSRPRWLAALLREIELAAAQWPAGTHLASIYLGGGTPSLLPPHELEAILAAIDRVWPRLPDAEITLEANPDDLSPETAAAWRSAGINRLSLGVQSLDDAELQAMNRSHSAAQALAAVESIRQAGFVNFSVDLIYATPWLDEATWQANLERILDLAAPHLSAYALTVEERTRLAYDVKTGRTPAVSDEVFARQFAYLHTRLAAAGYEGYEVSNFARPGWRAIHNSAYWAGRPYLGLGPSAASYTGTARWRNRPSVWAYIETLENGQLPRIDFEELSSADRLNEYLMTRLRLSEGLVWSELREHFGIDFAQVRAAELAELAGRGWLVCDERGARLTLAGRQRADGIAAALFA